jgi:hypothetical protein
VKRGQYKLKDMFGNGVARPITIQEKVTVDLNLVSLVS